MRSLLFLVLFFLFTSCSKPKVLLICGDHVCVNKAEAEQYFEENLTIEVKVIDKKKNKEFDLVELNLKDNEGAKKVNLSLKDSTNEKIKALSSQEVKEIKKIIKKKTKEKKKVKKITQKINRTNKSIDNIDIKSNKNKILEKNVNNERVDFIDVCTILDKCSIEEISKYLLQKAKKKDFPDITTRQ